MAPENIARPGSGRRARTQFLGLETTIDDKLSHLYNVRFEPPIMHLSPNNPWLPLLSPQQLVEINGAFRQFDRNGDGHIDVKEIQTVMGNLGYAKTMGEAKQIAASVDADGNGTIDFDEFVGMMAHRMLKSDGEAELQMAFATLFSEDVDASGHVPVEAIRRVFCTIGAHKLSDAEVDSMLGELGPTADGRVPYQKFRELECWDLNLPDGDIVSLRKNPRGATAPAAAAPRRHPAPHHPAPQMEVAPPASPMAVPPTTAAAPAPAVAPPPSAATSTATAAQPPPPAPPPAAAQPPPSTPPSTNEAAMPSAAPAEALQGGGCEAVGGGTDTSAAADGAQPPPER